MLSSNAIERYLDIQCQILDRKIDNLKSRTGTVKSGMVKEFKIKALKLERKKNRLKYNYYKIKRSGSKSYDLFMNKFNDELAEICKMYNNLFSQLQSSE